MDEAAAKKIPPSSRTAEQAVIGSMIMDRDTIADVADILTQDDFYDQRYGLVFRAMVDLYSEGKNTDLVIISDKLKEMGAPESVSNMDFLSEVYELASFSANASQYAQIVQDNSLRRSMIKFMEKTVDDCYSGHVDMESLLIESESKMTEIIQSRGVGNDYTPIDQIILNVVDEIDAATKRGSTTTGISTGFDDLDEKLTGLHGSELILIAARPAMGKTAFALNIAQHVTMKSNIPCVIFSLEMSQEQLGSRLIAMDSMVDSQAIRTGQLRDSEWEKLFESTYRVGSSPMIIYDTPGISVSELRSKCRKLKKKENIGLVIIDYLQLMHGSGRHESRQQEISEISRSLKEMARELDVPVIALSQLNRAVDSREDHKPVMSDLRESGAIEQDADVIMFIYRDDYYNKESEKPGIADIIVAKQRNGATGTVELVWLGKYTKFGNKERRHRNNG